MIWRRGRCKGETLPTGIRSVGLSQSLPLIHAICICKCSSSPHTYNCPSIPIHAIAHQTIIRAISHQTIIHAIAPQELKYWLPLPISSSEVSESGLMCFMICGQRRGREGAKSAGENATEFGKNKRRRKKYLQNRWWGKSNQKMPPNFAETKRIREPKIICKKGGEGGAKIRKCHRILQPQQQCKE